MRGTNPQTRSDAADRQSAGTAIGRAWSLLAGVFDPEIPVLSVLDLGIVRDVRETHGQLVVDVTPTYTGCPATEAIEADIVECLRDNGFSDVVLRRVLSPPWTTDWISAAGREKLRACGIAPPAAGRREAALPVACPRCASTETRRVSEFGSTACKAAWRCEACLEPFELFKCI